jgi:4-hydroxyphenylpyruvate dioxygenase
MPTSNPTGLLGIEFTEFSASDPGALHRLFTAFGFSKTRRHADQDITLYEQNDIRFLVNQERGSFSKDFSALHGPCISSMGWRVDDPRRALDEAVRRGARAFTGKGGLADVPAIYGIGDSLIYFIEAGSSPSYLRQFIPLDRPERVAELGFVAIDHLTNNVKKGTLGEWAAFYKNVFGFTEVRYFDIRGVQTGLVSYALRSPCGTFCIPINEGNEEKSQIEEYLREYRGPGVQHLAFLTKDLLASLDKLGGKVKTLDIDDDYYDAVFDRVPNVKEDRERIKRHRVLVDGDAQGYLLQIFTENVIGPIFIELIQRENHASFGEGNFGALFRSIERDQEKRGVL